MGGRVVDMAEPQIGARVPKPSFSNLWHRFWHWLAERIVGYAIAYWVLIAFYIINLVAIYRYYALFANYHDLMNGFSGFWTTGFIGLSIIWYSVIFALAFTYRKDSYVMLQRIRLFDASTLWLVAFMVGTPVLTFISAYDIAKPSPEFFGTASLLGLGIASFGVYMMAGFLLVGNSSRDFFGRYGNQKVIKLLVDFKESPKLLEPDASSFIFRKLYGIMNSVLSGAYVRLQFNELEDVVTNLCLAVSLGDDTEKEASKSFLQRLYEICKLGRRQPLEAGNQLMTEIQQLDSKLTRVNEIRREMGYVRTGVVPSPISSNNGMR
jgi:hypothetical protein